MSLSASIVRLSLHTQKWKYSDLTIFDITFSSGFYKFLSSHQSTVSRHRQAITEKMEKHADGALPFENISPLLGLSKHFSKLSSSEGHWPLQESYVTSLFLPFAPYICCRNIFHVHITLVKRFATFFARHHSTTFSNIENWKRGWVVPKKLRYFKKLKIW